MKMAKIKKQIEVPSKENGATRQSLKIKKKTLTPGVQSQKYLPKKMVPDGSAMQTVSTSNLNGKSLKKKNKKSAGDKENKGNDIDSADVSALESTIKILKKKYKQADALPTENVEKKKKAKKIANVDEASVQESTENPKKKLKKLNAPEGTENPKKKLKKVADQEDTSVPDGADKSKKKAKTLTTPKGANVSRTPEEIKAYRTEKRKLRKKKRLVELKNISTIKNKSSYSVFVGNLPVKTKREKLFKLFSKYGKINSIRFRLSNGAKLFKSQTKVTSPNVIAFVDFESEEDANASLVLNGEKIKDNVIRVNMQASVKTREDFDPKRTVFVGNLKYVVTDQSLHDFFTCCGEIDYTRTLRCEKGCIGSGYVCFKKPESVGMALELNNTPLSDRPIRVERYVKNAGKGAKEKKTEKGGAAAKKQRNAKTDNQKVKNLKKEFVGTKATDKKKNIKKKKILKGPKLLAKKIAHREKPAEATS